MPTDLNLVAVFIAVAEAKSFRGAAERLGVTRSAVSQAVRRMEDQLGVALVQRTTRSVSLTEAGERLYAEATPALAEGAGGGRGGALRRSSLQLARGRFVKTKPKHKGELTKETRTRARPCLRIDTRKKEAAKYAAKAR